MKCNLRIVLLYALLNVMLPLYAQFEQLEVRMTDNSVLLDKKPMHAIKLLASGVAADNWQSSVAYKGYNAVVSPCSNPTYSTRTYRSFAGGSTQNNAATLIAQQTNTQLPSYYTAQKLNLMVSMPEQQDGEGLPDPNPEPNPNPTPISDIPWGVIWVLLGGYVMYKRH